MRVYMCSLGTPPRRTEEVSGSAGTVVTDGWEPPLWVLGIDPGPLQEQQVLLTTEPSIQSPVVLTWHKLESLGKGISVRDYLDQVGLWHVSLCGRQFVLIALIDLGRLGLKVGGTILWVFGLYKHREGKLITKQACLLSWWGFPLLWRDTMTPYKATLIRDNI